MKKTVWQILEKSAGRWTEIARNIGQRPELGYEEFFASGLLTEQLEAAGFRVTRNVLDMETAFIAEYRSPKPGPVLGLLCEYDALPELGHACGHHLICTMSLAAAISLIPAVDQLGGTVRVYGTPAEETSGAKVPMASAGLFDDLDAALMAHPHHRYEASGTSLAMDAVQVEFFGKAAHAAANPQDGINALDAVLLLFNAINALRQQTRSDTRIHGIIADGGKAPNIIPDYACARFYVRSEDRAYTSVLTEKLKACAQGAAQQTGCTVDIGFYEFSYDELRTNEVLSDAFNRNLNELGIPSSAIHRGKDNGSLDLGNVSHRCPAIHPYVQICEAPYALHTPEFRDAAMSEEAFGRMLIGAKALAGTACDLLADPALRAEVKRAFQQHPQTP